MLCNCEPFWERASENTIQIQFKLLHWRKMFSLGSVVMQRDRVISRWAILTWVASNNPRLTLRFAYCLGSNICVRPAWNGSAHLKSLGCCDVYLLLFRMIDWLSWPLAQHVETWVIALLKGLAAVQKFTILIDVTLLKIELVRMITECWDYYNTISQAFLL